MIIKKFKVGPLKTNCYLLIDKKTKDAIVIDPGEKDEEILNTIREFKAKVKYICLTHSHWDHIKGVCWLKAETNAKVLAHEKAKKYLEDERYNLSHLHNIKHLCVYPDKFLKDKDVVKFGSIKLTVIHTPGHSPGGICLYNHNLKVIFVGDTLFRRTIGRVDLPNGNLHELISSIKNKLMCLSDDVIAYPGHGMETKIGDERRGNNFLH